MCYGLPAKSLDQAKKRLTHEQWEKFEREFDDFCVVQGLVKPPEHLRHVQRYTHDLLCAQFDWARWAFFQGLQMGAAMPVNTGDRLTDEKANHIIARDGFKMTGVVLCKPNNDRCIVEMSAVRWLSNDEMWAILHPVESPGKSADQRVADAKYTRLAIAMMSDEQAVASLERWMRRGE